MPISTIGSAGIDQAAIQELKALVDGQAVIIATQASTITALQADVEALKAR